MCLIILVGCSFKQFVFQSCFRKLSLRAVQFWISFAVMTSDGESLGSRLLASLTIGGPGPKGSDNLPKIGSASAIGEAPSGAGMELGSEHGDSNASSVSGMSVPAGLAAVGFALRLSGQPIVPNQGRAGRKAAMARLAAVVPEGMVQKALPENNGMTIRGMLFKREDAEGFRQKVAPLGQLSFADDASHQRQVAFDRVFRKDREREAQSLILASEASQVIRHLQDLRGRGGSASSRARFADSALEILAVGQRVAANATAPKRMRYTLGAKDDGDEEEEEKG